MNNNENFNENISEELINNGEITNNDIETVKNIVSVISKPSSLYSINNLQSSIFSDSGNTFPKNYTDLNGYSLHNYDESFESNNLVIGSFGAELTGCNTGKTSLGGFESLAENSYVAHTPTNKSECNWNESAFNAYTGLVSEGKEIKNVTVETFSNATTGCVSQASTFATNLVEWSKSSEENVLPEKLNIVVSGTGDFGAGRKRTYVEPNYDALKETNANFLFVCKDSHENSRRDASAPTEYTADELIDSDGLARGEYSKLNDQMKGLIDNDIPVYVASIDFEKAKEIFNIDGNPHEITSVETQSLILNLQNNPSLQYDEEFMNAFKQIVNLKEVVRSGDKLESICSVDAYLDTFDIGAMAYTGNILNVRKEDGSSTLSSDLYDITYSVGEVAERLELDSVGNIDNASILNRLSDTTTSIPASLNDMNKSLFSINDSLTGKLNEELKLIASAALTIYNMDSKLAQSASTLSDLSGVSGYDETLSKCIESLNIDDDFNINNYKTLTNFSFNDGIGNLAGKVSLDSLDGLIGPHGALINQLDGDISSAQQAKNGIADCSATLNNYQGEIWKVVVDKLEVYDNAMDLRIKIDNELKDVYNEAYNLIKNYMDPYETLDDGQIDTLETKITNLNKKISDCTSRMNEKKPVEHTFSIGKLVVSRWIEWEFVLSAGERAALQAEIDGYNEEIIEAQKELDKLYGLNAVIKQAEDLISNAVTRVVNEYGSNVNDISVGTVSR